MRHIIFFLLTLAVCVAIGILQMVTHTKLPVWASFAIGAALAYPLINWISHVIDSKYTNKRRRYTDI